MLLAAQLPPQKPRSVDATNHGKSPREAIVPPTILGWGEDDVSFGSGSVCLDQDDDDGNRPLTGEIRAMLKTVIMVMMIEVKLFILAHASNNYTINEYSVRQIFLRCRMSEGSCLLVKVLHSGLHRIFQMRKQFSKCDSNAPNSETQVFEEVGAIHLY